MGVHDPARVQLAPGDVALAHAGLLDLRTFSRRPPYYERRDSRGQRDPAVSRVEKTDGRILAQRMRRRAVRMAPGARRISGLGLRTERRVEHVFHGADDLGLRPLHSPT